MSRSRVALVDDHRVVRQALRTYLESFGDFEVVGEASSGEELLAEVAGWRPDVIVLDLFMPGGMDGLAAAAELFARHPGSRIVFLTAHGDEARLEGALRAGALGFVRKDSTPEVFLGAVRAAALGQVAVDPELAPALRSLASAAADALTARETEVLRELAHGRTNREIAARCGIGAETVKSHVASILAKLGLAHRTQAALHAVKTGLVPLEELRPGRDEER